MKKWIALTLAFAMVLGLTACAASTDLMQNVPARAVDVQPDLEAGAAAAAADG